MKSTLFTFCFLLLSLLSFAQNDKKIVIGTIDSVQSKILNEKRKLWIHVPAGAASGQRYPVVYLLDGDGHFSSVVGMIEQLSTINGNTICPEMIVVGIPNTDRTRDLTPTRAKPSGYVDSNFVRTSGGGEQFLAFIEKELMPHIEALYPTAPYKMLIGHSLGGLMVMQTLIHHPQMFNAYVAIDPSMWWDRQTLLKEAKKALVTEKYPGKSLYLGIANTMEDGMDIKKVIIDTSQITEHIRAILDLDKHLTQNKQNQLKYKSKYYGDDSHGSVPLITEYDALRYIFDFYPLKMTQKDFTDTTGILATKMEKNAQLRSKNMGYKVDPPEGMINMLGYQSLNGKHYKLAERYFKMNTINYPKSFNVFDSYGDYYLAIGDKKNAIANFEKALSIQENPESRQKLDELKNGKKAESQLSPEALQKYAGDYELAGVGVTIKIYVKNNVLMVSSPLQDEAEMYSTSPNKFMIRNINGYLLQFEMNGDKPKVIHITTPDASYDAAPKQ